MTEYTEHEADTIRAGVLGAISLVSRSEPGFLAAFRESAAGARALGGLPEDLRSLVTKFDLPDSPRGEELSRLSEGLAIVDAKDPESATALRAVVLEACEAVAGSAKGVSDTEKAALDQVRHVVGASTPVEDRSGTVSTRGADEKIDVPGIPTDI
jgi:hypothetical protein